MVEWSSLPMGFNMPPTIIISGKIEKFAYFFFFLIFSISIVPDRSSRVAI